MKKFYLLILAIAAATCAQAVEREIVTLPEDIVSETWILSHEYEVRPVKVAISGTDIYVGDLTNELPDSYVKGKIDGSTVSLPLTYLGYSNFMESDVYFVPCVWETRYSPEYEMDVEDYWIIEEYLFDYDAEAKKLTNAMQYGACLIGDNDDVGALGPAFIDYYYEPSIRYIDPALADEPIEDPTFVVAYDETETIGGTIIGFFLPSQNEAGYPLDTNRLYYVFYVDGEPFTFTTDVYEGFEEDMTEIPYDFYDDLFDIYSYGEIHEVTLYIDDFTTVGVKMYYTDEEGNIIQETNYVQANVEDLYEETSTPSIVGDQIIDVKYYDVYGRQIACPASGLYIRVTTTSSGARTAQKLVK